MAQFDVYRNPSEMTKKQFPYLLDVQNSLHSRLKSRLVVPLTISAVPIKHLTPEFMIEHQHVAMSTMDMASVSLDVLGELVINIEEHRNDIVDALDFLVNGF